MSTYVGGGHDDDEVVGPGVLGSGQHAPFWGRLNSKRRAIACVYVCDNMLFEHNEYLSPTSYMDSLWGFVCI